MMDGLTAWFSGGLQALFLAVVILFALYVFLELRVVMISRRVERRKLAELDRQADVDVDTLPPVTVLLPVRNEAAMVERLIDAACRLRYPTALLEILVLDDSSDTTTALAQVKVNEYANQGINIRVICREQRRGFKAGNLMHGIQQARGDFYAIFDADFVPPVDFLLETIPHFTDPKLGFLQTSIGYENAGKSFLTRFQAMEMGHQQYVTVGLSEDGDMASLSGSSCVWRKSCVEALGGWNATTATEDVDLGYRAQFDHWKYAYLREVVSMSVLPETASAFRVQRERWGRGLIHSAWKHLHQMLRQPMPMMRRLHALAMMFSSLLLALIHILFVLTLPLAYLVEFEGHAINWAALAFYLLVAIWALDNAFGARKGAHLGDRTGILRTLWHTYLYVTMFLPMAWHYCAGGIRALFGVHGDFQRTPKGHGERSERTPPINNLLLLGEAFWLVYSLAAIGIALARNNWFLLPLNITACIGFGMMLYWSWQERRSREQT